MLEYQKWIIKLLRFGFDIQYKLRPKNKAVVALSQLPSSIEVASVIMASIVEL